MRNVEGVWINLGLTVVCVYIYIYIYTHTHTHTHTHIYIYIYNHVCLYTGTICIILAADQNIFKLVI